ncbi:hypothetical protein GQ53DRAFT_773779 [Thozetella sp. PMI_491]|nr:hypothetical protein GQ53DRAFT_773779 [Thozetella sp. PMI_491]
MSVLALVVVRAVNISNVFRITGSLVDYGPHGEPDKQNQLACSHFELVDETVIDMTPPAGPTREELAPILRAAVGDLSFNLHGRAGIIPPTEQPSSYYQATNGTIQGIGNVRPSQGTVFGDGMSGTQVPMMGRSGSQQGQHRGNSGYDEYQGPMGR